MPLHQKGKISALADRDLIRTTQVQYPQKNLRLVICSISLEFQEGKKISHNHILTLHNATLESTLNGKSRKLLLTEESLLDLKWHNTIDNSTDKTGIPVQPVRVGAKLSSSKLAPGKLIDVQDAGKSSEPDDAGLHIQSQVCKGCSILSSKTSPVCHSSNKSSLGVK